MTQPKAAVGDHVTIIASRYGYSRAAGKTGVVRFVNEGLTSPFVYRVVLDEDLSACTAYNVEVIDTDTFVDPEGPTPLDVLTDDAIRRYAALVAARAALPADLLTDDYLTAASYIDTGMLSFVLTSTGQAVDLPVEYAGNDDRTGNALPEATGAVARRDLYEATYTNPDDQGDRLEYYITATSSSAPEMVFAINTETAGADGTARLAALVTGHDLRALRDYLTAVLEGK